MRVFGVTARGEISIARRPGPPAPPSKDGPRANEDIQADPVRLVDADGEMVGVIGLQEAIDMAVEVGLDLVEVSPNADPPVCKILDYGKHLFSKKKIN